MKTTATGTSGLKSWLPALLGPARLDCSCLTLAGLLQVIGEYHLGEFVNRFRHGSLVMQMADSEAAKIPTVLFGTITGVIGVLASLPADTYLLLDKLQVPPKSPI